MKATTATLASSITLESVSFRFFVGESWRIKEIFQQPFEMQKPCSHPYASANSCLLCLKCHFNVLIEWWHFLTVLVRDTHHPQWVKNELWFIFDLFQSIIQRINNSCHICRTPTVLGKLVSLASQKTKRHTNGDVKDIHQPSKGKHLYQGKSNKQVLLQNACLVVVVLLQFAEMRV